MEPRPSVRAYLFDLARFLPETPLISHYSSLCFLAGDAGGRLSDAVHGAGRQGVLQAGDGRRAGRMDGGQVQGRRRRARGGNLLSGEREEGYTPAFEF